MLRTLRFLIFALSTSVCGLLVSEPASGQGLGLQAGFTPFGKNKVMWREFDWRIYQSPHFDVYYYPEAEPMLEKVVSFAESAYDSISRALDFQITDRTTLIYYATHSAFQQNNIIVNFIPEGTGAFATPVRHRMVLPVDLTDPELMGLIRHELTHIFQYHILFGASAAAGVNRPPTWFMEGMASYFGEDETPAEKMYLRDAVVNDAVPPISRVNIGGFMAYRFGHAVFDYIEHEWGQDGVRDFVYEVRNTLGSSPARALRRVFNVEPEDFDANFRRWLRRAYLPELATSGEPSDFGRPFRAHETRASAEISPAASPSGDLVAAFSTVRGDLDVVLFDASSRELLRNLTRGYTSKFEDFVVQEATRKRSMGRDIAFSSDGNRLAAFAKRGPDLDLVLLDVLKGGVDRIISIDVERPFSPAWSPDGRTIAFAGFRGGQFDVFLHDLQTGENRNLTDDAIYDGAPTFTPDGRSVIVSSVIGEHAKLFRVDLDDPSTRYQLTRGEGNDVDAVVTPNGKRVFFTSDRTGAQNIYSLDLETGRLVQHTNAVTGCFQPTVLASAEGPMRVVYTGFWRGRFGLYELNLREPITPGEVLVDADAESFSPRPAAAAELPAFEPPIEVTLDDANVRGYKAGRFFLEDAGALVGVSSADQVLLGTTYLSFSDQLGDQRILGLINSFDNFQDIHVIYSNSRRRWQWGVHLFDTRTFSVFRDSLDPFDPRIERRSRFTQTGALGSVTYPFSLYRRFEAGVGYMQRKQQFPFLDLTETGELFINFRVFRDDFPFVQLGFVGDTAVFAPWGPIAGSAWSVQTSYAPDTSGGGTLARDLRLDARYYLPVTRRSNLALRGWGGMSDGNSPNVYFFGGLNDFRGVRFREFSGNRAFFTNVEYRFPLLDIIATPVLNFQGIRGRIFLDVGGAWFDSFDPAFDESFRFWDSDENRLADGQAAYGYGLTVNFLGLDLNWDFAKQWDGKDSLTPFQSSFWIGWQF